MKKLFTRTISIALMLAVAISCAKEEKPAERKHDLKFMVFTDIHFMHPDILIKEGKAFEEYNREECKLLRESPDIFKAALDAIRSEKPDFVLVCGDMTKDGELICHQYVADAFKKIEAETGTHILVVPGNHDMNNPHCLYYDGDVTKPAEKTTETKFEEIYSDLGFSEAVERRAGYLDYMSYPAEGVAVICVDSNEKNTADEVLTQGGLDKTQVAWIKNAADRARRDGRHVFMMMHHNLVDFYDHASLIRGANIANARYDYTNAQLIDDLCAAGVDVVFSGHSHMHSITSATSGSHTIHSIVTSSLVNLPLAYRCGTITKDGVLKMISRDLKDCHTSTGVDLRKEGDKYWYNLSGYYMGKATNLVWENAGFVLQIMDVFKTKEDLQNFLDTRCKGVFYTFLTRTSDGDEHLVSPDKNTQDAMDAVDGVIQFLEEKGVRQLIADLLKRLLGFGLDEMRQTMNELFTSAYHNCLGGIMTPDAECEIQL